MVGDVKKIIHYYFLCIGNGIFGLFLVKHNQRILVVKYQLHASSCIIFHSTC